MTPLARRAAVAVASLLVAAAPASAAFAWGATGHRLIGRLGVATLPDDLPGFLRTPQAVEAVGELAREPDRWKGSGLEHDPDRNPAHYVDIGDDGKIAGGPALAALPATRSDYETALHAAGTDSYHAGYLPYSIVDGWQQLTKDLAYWRVLTVAIPRERDPDRKAWLQRDLVRREALTLRDLGVWAHYVGDASQPMHVSIHHDGWGAYPNPQGYTEEKVHVPFESAFVRANIDQAVVRAAMTPSSPCEGAIEACVGHYLAATSPAWNRSTPCKRPARSWASPRRPPAAIFLAARPSWPSACRRRRRTARSDHHRLGRQRPRDRRLSAAHRRPGGQGRSRSLRRPFRRGLNRSADTGGSAANVPRNRPGLRLNRCCWIWISPR